MSNYLPPHGLQHTRPPCPSPTPRVYVNSCPLSWWCHPTISSSVIPLSSYLQSFPSSRSFQWVISSHQWSKYWSFSFSISPSNGYSGVISFRMDWLGLLAVQGTLKSLLQHHISKASILKCSAYFTIQLSHPYMTSGKTIGFTLVHFSHSVVSDSLQPPEAQHGRPPCPSSIPGVHPSSRPLSRWCHPPFHPLSSPYTSALNLSQHQGLF